MIIIPYPDPDFRLKTENGKDFIFDTYRKLWIFLTEEEWVRQNLIAYLVKDLKYPSALIALEKEIFLGELKKRFDILIYDPGYKPWMMIECKAPSVPLTPEVLHQVLRYNISLPVPYITITNGTYTIVYDKSAGKLNELSQFPSWDNFHSDK